MGKVRPPPKHWRKSEQMVVHGASVEGSFVHSLEKNGAYFAERSRRSGSALKPPSVDILISHYD